MLPAYSVKANSGCVKMWQASQKLTQAHQDNFGKKEKKEKTMEETKEVLTGRTLPRLSGEGGKEWPAQTPIGKNFSER